MLCCLAFASVAPLHAAERVYLTTGSNLICDHHQNLSGQIRLYFTPSGDNYMDLSANQVLRMETVSSASGIGPAQNPPRASGGATQLNLPALLERAGTAHDIDPDLLASVVHAESAGRTSAISRAGARGLMQLMPGTAADLGVHDSLAADQNVAGGTTYLDALLMYYHDNLALTLAAYNAGPAAVSRYGGVPPYPETRRYVQRVIHDYNRRKRLEARQRALAAVPKRRSEKTP